MFITRSIPLWLAAVGAALLITAGVFIGVRQARMNTEQAERLGKLEAENQRLRDNSESLLREVEALRSGEPVPAETPARGDRARISAEYSSAKLEHARLIAELNDKLVAAESSIRDLRNRIQELETGIEQVKLENKRLADAETETNEKLAGANRILDAVQAELKTRNERLVQVETSNRLLREQNRTLEQKTNNLPRLLQEFEELNRRRETYLSNVMRRYRDVTEQYRAVCNRANSPDTDAVAAGPELARIENSISLAEEDLRQLASLNAQAQRVRKSIAGK